MIEVPNWLFCNSKSKERDKTFIIMLHSERLEVQFDY